ncbi:hypothetical protein ONZ45_g224 [Pleurotus djamor]|nr:hypothetical protein ONZ45_g224 [Pleurotus djamor]
MSSPLYEGDIVNLSQEDLQAIDQLEAKLSQPSTSQSPIRRKLPPDAPESSRSKRARMIEEALSQDVHASSSNPQDHNTDARESPQRKWPGFTSAFQRASNIPQDPPEDKDDDDYAEGDADRDYSSWFDSGTTSLPALFQSAKNTHIPSISSSSAALPTLGFSKASGLDKPAVLPSAAAIAKAQARMRQWEQEDEENNPPEQSSPPPNRPSLFTSALGVTPQRPAFRALENQYTPDTPSPVGFSSASFSSAGNIGSSRDKGKSRQFKPPLLSTTNRTQQQTAHTNSPLNPRPQQPGFQRPIQPRIPSLQIQPSATPIATTPANPRISNTSHLRHTPAKFKTPFKAGVRPSATTQAGSHPPIITPARPGPGPPLFSNATPASSSKTPKRTFFDLKKPPNRHTLATSGLLPQSYSLDDLQDLGINPQELSQMSPTLALYYTFHTTSASPALVATQASQAYPRLGPTEAFDELISRGCSLATKPWVENHWSLILWKLAGMVALEPEKEGDPATKKWCWQEVIRQLLYRYERELSGGSRPPLRLISTQDAPSSCPMILCVSNITWSEAPPSTEGIPLPEVEVTDGWYRLRAEVDEPLARAIHKGTIKAGRKIAVAGARLSSERKDPMEILEAYNSVKLVISGNSSHLAPWHAKLGFQQGPFVSTLHSLTHDGGHVAVMDVVITKPYSIGYLEFPEDDKRDTVAPQTRSEAEEATEAQKWRKRRQAEADKLHDALEKKVARYEAYADRLERKAGSHFPPVGEDGPPDVIDGLYDQLEDPDTANAALSRITPRNAGWLAHIVRERIITDRETASIEMGRELDDICPPRNVRNFRVLEVQDSCTRRRPRNRTAQITVWDVLNLTFSEGGKPGAFEIGERFLVTNLIPRQPSAWMGYEAGAMVYLSTRRDTRWTKLKASRG